MEVRHGGIEMRKGGRRVREITRNTEVEKGCGFEEKSIKGNTMFGGRARFAGLRRGFKQRTAKGVGTERKL